MKYKIIVLVIATISITLTNADTKEEQNCERWVDAYTKGLEVGEATGGNSKQLALNKNEINSLKEKMTACEVKSEIMQKNHKVQ